MQAVGAMVDFLVKVKWHPCQKKSTKKEGSKIPVLAAVGSTADIFL